MYGRTQLEVWGAAIITNFLTSGWPPSSFQPEIQKLGLSGETVGKFAPIVLQYVTGKGGSGVGNLLGAVLK